MSTSLRGLLALFALITLVGCADHSTAPHQRADASALVPTTAAHDDIASPDALCRSGYSVAEGRTCTR